MFFLLFFNPCDVGTGRKYCTIRNMSTGYGYDKKKSFNFKVDRLKVKFHLSVTPNAMKLLKPKGTLTQAEAGGQRQGDILILKIVKSRLTGRKIGEFCSIPQKGWPRKSFDAV